MLRELVPAGLTKSRRNGDLSESTVQRCSNELIAHGRGLGEGTDVMVFGGY